MGLKEQQPRTVKNYRANDDEMKLIQKNADKYTNGDVSKWVRYAAMNCVPKKEDLARESTSSKSA